MPPAAAQLLAAFGLLVCGQGERYARRNVPEGPIRRNAGRLVTFATMDIKDFDRTAPVLLPEEYLAHELEGRGVVERLRPSATLYGQGAWGVGRDGSYPEFRGNVELR